MILVHDWYPPECCGGGDCHPVPCDEIVETDKGFRWKDVTFPSANVRPTQDGKCHVCDGWDSYPVKHHGWCVFILPSS